MRTLSLLEEAGIPFMSSLSDHTWDIQKALHLVSFFDLDLNTLLDAWLGGFVGMRPTWNNLLLVTRFLNLDDLAEQVETYLSGRRVEHPMRGRRGAVINDGEKVDICPTTQFVYVHVL